MEDRDILKLYAERSEDAILETKEKYGKYLRTIVHRILSNAEDEEEVMDDVYLSVWKALEFSKPVHLQAYLSRIARNHAITRLRMNRGLKRGGREVVLSVEELSEVVRGTEDVESRYSEEELRKIIEEFLRGLKENERSVFIFRYYYFESVKEIAKAEHINEATLRVMLHRIRRKLRERLLEEGYEV